MNKLMIENFILKMSKNIKDVNVKYVSKYEYDVKIRITTKLIYTPVVFIHTSIFTLNNIVTLGDMLHIKNLLNAWEV